MRGFCALVPAIVTKNRMLPDERLHSRPCIDMKRTISSKPSHEETQRVHTTQGIQAKGLVPPIFEKSDPRVHRTPTDYLHWSHAGFGQYMARTNPAAAKRGTLVYGPSDLLQLLAVERHDLQ